MMHLKLINYEPEYALDLQGWNSNHFIFEKLIIEYKPNIIAEVGSWKGASAIHMANICKKNNLNSKIYCIDTWLGGFDHILNNFDDLKIKNGYPQLYYQFLSNVFITNNQDLIIPVPNTSYIGYIYLKYNNIKPNLIYIDGSHEYEDVVNDIKNYYDLLADGGVIFGDDFHDCIWPDVKRGVVDFCRNKNINFKIEDGKWIINK